MDLGIAGKRALVTGSTSGIGESIAKTLAQEGVIVAVQGRREGEAKRVAQEITKAGGKAVLAIGDLSTDAGAEAVAKAATAALGGGVDILVNNAGIYPAKGWFNETPSEWNDVYNVNVASMVRVINLLVPGMRDRKWGRVVSIASGVATRPLAGMPAYSATKIANVSLIVSLAGALEGSGVTCNAVSPGLIMTPGVHEMFDKMGLEKNEDLRLTKAAEFAPNPLKRAGKPQEIADAVTYLCSQRASYVNGQNLRVDGGFVPTVN